jgi:glyoxylase-like metal-dependent hydrolase (beta-lactamase superfamily II)
LSHRRGERRHTAAGSERAVKIGRIEIAPVLDGRILSMLHGTKPLPEPASPLWHDQHGMFTDDGLLESTLGAFLVRTGDRVALIDAGAGQRHPGGYVAPVIDVEDPDDPVGASLTARGLPVEVARAVAADFSRTDIAQGELPVSLAALGVQPGDVTDVILTHLHFDHIGWVSADGAPCFANATIRCATADLEYFLAEPAEEVFTSHLFRAPRAGERLAPVRDRIETWDRDTTLMPGVDVRLAPGHTPGSSVVVVSDGPARALMLGDIIHCPLELMDDDFNLLVDHDQELANRVREAYARELEGSATVAAAAHFPGLRFGRLLAGDATRRWTFVGA